ncbi:hypothetical protein BH10CYA1_BH10CYA1_59990 [soil metagenome]
MTRDETQASPFAALFEWERKNGGGGGGRAKMQLEAKGGFKLRVGSKGERRFHAGHYLANTKINNIVKIRYVKNNHDAARHIVQHIDYIQKRERDVNEPERKFYGRNGERSRDDVIESVMENRGEKAAMFKIILSPKQNELNHVEYTSEIMRRFEEKTGIVTDWSLVQHKNTEYHHVHIVMPGKDMNGREYRIEPEDLDLFRELANEYQYELQGIDYEREKQIQHEFGYTRDEAELILILAKDRQHMKELDVYKPEVDKLVRDDLLKPTNFDDIYFAQQIQKEIWKEASQEFNNWSENLQEKHPELFPGLVRQLQGEHINNAYFNKVKEFHPALYYEHLHDPTLDRQPVIDRLKQAFPEWYDGIVEKLKEEQPKLFANYEKPDPTEREIMDNLRETKPDLFPELSIKIQENQLNTVTMARLATVNPGRLEQILAEENQERQKELIAKARGDYPDIVEHARERLSEMFPKIYQHGEKQGPSDRDIMEQLVKEHPTLFPHATHDLQKHAVDEALFERLREVNPKLAMDLELDPHLRGVATTFIRFFYPNELKKANELVREQQPDLFKYERKEPSESEILKALEKERPELYPDTMRKLKEQEVNKAYFERGTKESPDGLRAYIQNPDLSRFELYKVLKNTHPEWRADIEKDLKETHPEFFRFDREHPTDRERIAYLHKMHPELFRDKRNSEQGKELEIEPSSRLEKLEQIKDQLVDRGVFAKGRENMSDGLIEYLENADYDRKYIVDGLKLTHPEWVKEIEGNLRKHQPELFSAIDQEQNIAIEDAQERINELSRLAIEHSPGEFAKEAVLLLAIANGKEPVDKQLPDKVRTGDDADRTSSEPDKVDDQGKPVDDQEKSSDESKTEQLLDTAGDAMLKAENLKTGREWVGLMGFQDPGFVAQPVNLTAEAQALFKSQQDISKELNEFESDVMLLDPNLFKLEETLDDVKQELDDIDKDDSDRSL